MIITFWHEPEDVLLGTAEDVWIPIRTGSKKPLTNQDSWKEKDDKIYDEDSRKIGKKFSITWDDGNHDAKVVCFYPPAKKFKV